MRKWPPSLPPRLTAEAVLTWLDGYRQFMFEIWKKNPELRRRWEKMRKSKD